MKTKFKDVAHLYLGCDMYSVPQSNEYFIEKLTGVHSDMAISVNGNLDYPEYDSKPILRPLSDMTDEECNSYNKIQLTCYSAFPFKDQCIQEALKVKFLLSLGFDLFGLIESNEAIDKTTLK